MRVSVQAKQGAGGVAQCTTSAAANGGLLGTPTRAPERWGPCLSGIPTASCRAWRRASVLIQEHKGMKRWMLDRRTPESPWDLAQWFVSVGCTFESAGKDLKRDSSGSEPYSQRLIYLVCMGPCHYNFLRNVPGESTVWPGS